MISSAIYSISDTICVDNNTIFSDANELISFLNLTRSLGSSPTVGSSNIKISGLLIIA